MNLQEIRVGDRVVVRIPKLSLQPYKKTDDREALVTEVSDGRLRVRLRRSTADMRENHGEYAPMPITILPDQVLGRWR